MISQVWWRTPGWLLNRLLIIGFLLVIFGCHSSPPSRQYVKPESTIILSNQTLKMQLMIPPSFNGSEAVMSPISGFQLKDVEDQIYGFVSYKIAKFSSSSNLIDLLESNFNYDWDNFTSHWEEYLQQRGIEVEISMYENLLKRDIWGNYVRIKQFTIKFPGTLVINTPMVGQYAEEMVGHTTPPSTVYPAQRDKKWFDATTFEVLFVETLLPANEISPQPRIISSFLVTPITKNGSLYEKIAYDLRQNSNLCIGRCEIGSVEEHFSSQATTPVEILFFVKNTPGMTMELNQFPELVEQPLLQFLTDNSIPYKIAISTLSNPSTLKTIDGKLWLSNSDKPDDFFKIETTTETLRNAIIEKALNAVTTASEKGLFNNSQERMVVFVSDRDDQSVTPDGNPISLTNLTQYLKVYKQSHILPYGIIGISDQSSFYCDSPEPCNILKKFIYLLGGRIADICSKYRGTFYFYLIRDAMINSSKFALSFPPVKNSVVVERNNSTYLKWGFPDGFFVDSEQKKLIITPPTPGKVTVSYKYFIKKY